jgi:hypothetical protein
METFVNKVAESGIVTIDLEQFLPTQEFMAFDIQPYLFMGMILKEKDFRQALKDKDFSEYSNKIVCVYCSADAIVPVWAYMLITTYLKGIASDVHFGTIEQVKANSIRKAINELDINNYSGQRVVIKGCGDEVMPQDSYVAMTHKLLPVAKSIMYGEPCSTVPIL